MSTPHTEPTFRAYNADQANLYSTHRESYSPVLYDEIIRHHKQFGNGSFGTVLDVGCGPGNATRDLSQYFDRAIGVDPGEEMIASAKTASEKYTNAEFAVCAAEQIESLRSTVPDGVDLITAAMAAHWFDMSKFYPQALTILKPGGTVALWTKASLYCHPIKTPNAERVQQILWHFEDVVLGRYELPPNRLSRNMYDDLVLPWSLPHVDGIGSFDQAKFVRKTWNRDGALKPGASDFFAGSHTQTLGQLAEGLGTASMVTRWREGNPELANTEQDCVRRLMRELAATITGHEVEEGDVSWKNVEIQTGGGTALLLFSRTSA